MIHLETETRFSAHRGNAIFSLHTRRRFWRKQTGVRISVSCPDAILFHKTIWFGGRLHEERASQYLTSLKTAVDTIREKNARIEKDGSNLPPALLEGVLSRVTIQLLITYISLGAFTLRASNPPTKMEILHFMGIYVPH